MYLQGGFPEASVGGAEQAGRGALWVEGAGAILSATAFFSPGAGRSWESHLVTDVCAG